VKATLHWVSATENVEAEVRLYDRLFHVEDPSGDKDSDFRDHLEPRFANHPTKSATSNLL
jgi:glutaminyl-tRNA synthetase